MNDLFLIAHKVRGGPAFDIAVRMDCPLCAAHGHDLDGVCHECKGTRFWWIIPTSGHRAYPFHFVSLSDLGVDRAYDWNGSWEEGAPLVRDHYAAAEPRVPVSRPKPTPPTLNSILDML